MKLLPCPFCGSSNVGIENIVTIDSLVWVSCGQCGDAEGPPAETTEEAETLWNTRIKPEAEG